MYSGLYGDYSSFSEEYDELSDAEYDPASEEESALPEGMYEN